VFCYETLHHFPDPGPIIKEIYRVLSPGGLFFFQEEPYKKLLQLNLYKGKKIYSEESLHGSTIRKIVDYFFSESFCNEVEHGIIENHEIPIGIWKQALSMFKEKAVKLLSMKMIYSELFRPRNYVKFLLAYLLGGEISGICHKSGDGLKREISIYDTLMCPRCDENGRESKIDQKNHTFICSECGNKFPIIDGVAFLFSYKKFEEIYPEIFSEVAVSLK
jgi:uncharacterized protein YbaR (Trm112 family)